ncbi:MAG: flippase [Campylobacterota bacterium]|nr:flippase [Campylobacterota bacterium]
MINKFKKNHEIIKYFKNTSWMMGEKIIKIIVLLIINVILARYLGPKEFGFLSYVISLVSLFAIATHMGLSGLVVKELVSFKDNKDIILGTVFVIKWIGALIGFSILLLIAFFTEELWSFNFWVLIIISCMIFFKPFEVIDFWFNATVQAKYTAISNTIAILLGLIIKILFIASGMGLLWIAFTYFIEAFFIAILFIYFYYKKDRMSIFSWSFSSVKAKELLSRGWMIMLGSVFAIIYLKVDQVMLKWLVGDESVGIYAVAASLSEAWYFVPTVIVASLFPKLIELKESNSMLYTKRLQQLFDFLLTLALIIAIIVTIISNDVIDILYGEEYKEAAIILSIHIWASLFIFMRAAFSKWIIMEDVLMFSLITQGFGALTNIILNLVLIPYYDIYGAAIATFLSYAIASYFSLFAYKKTKPIFKMMTKSFFAPIRYILPTIRLIKK